MKFNIGTWVAVFCYLLMMLIVYIMIYSFYWENDLFMFQGFQAKYAYSWREPKVIFIFFLPKVIEFIMESKDVLWNIVMIYSDSAWLEHYVTGYNDHTEQETEHK